MKRLRAPEPVQSLTTTARNKALVLTAFDTLFNKRDYVTAARFWSDSYIQHSSNVTSGPETGIGSWSGEDLVRAMHNGARKGRQRKEI